MKLFENRKLVIATKHQKESVFKPLLEKSLGVSCIVPDNFDTDQWGTFSGEIDRKDDVLQTLRKKCFHAMAEYQCDLAVASEGSFGPHPTVFFAHADDEVVMFLDKKNDLEIVTRELSTETNFNGQYVSNKNELREFAHKIGFPQHGLILKSAERDFSKVVKGIIDERTLLDAFGKMKDECEKVYVETDMRALFNPTRMKVIQKAAEKLVQTILTECPTCQTPGFSVTDVKEGLPCEWCHRPTSSTLSLISTCRKCGFQSEEKYPHQKKTEDPMYCNYCNP